MYRKRKILQGRRGDTRHGSSRYERVENIQRKEKICRISASETRTNRPEGIQQRCRICRK